MFTPSLSIFDDKHLVFTAYNLHNQINILMLTCLWMKFWIKTAIMFLICVCICRIHTQKLWYFIYFKINTISKIRPDKYNDIIQDGKHTTLTLMVFETELWRIKMFKLKVKSNKGWELQTCVVFTKKRFLNLILSVSCGNLKERSDNSKQFTSS